MFWNPLHAWRQRSLPRCLASARHVRGSYSQFGEDALIYSLLGYLPDGRYLDVGCFHPIQYSNTYGLYCRGWRGVGVDANVAMAPLWRRWRPRDAFVNAAVLAAEGPAWFVEDSDHPGESRVVLGDEPPPAPSARHTVAAVRATPLSAIVRDHGHLFAAGIQLLSIDCEGGDLAALMSFDFGFCRPRVVIVEVLDQRNADEMNAFLVALGYAPVATMRFSHVFTHKSQNGATA